MTQAPTTPTGCDVWYDWGGAGPTVHFAHANGFPPGTYRKLAEALKKNHHVVSMAARPLWSDEAPMTLHSWSPFVTDLRNEFDGRGMRGIIGVGHSLGAVVTLLAAAADPGLFSAVVAVDPLILTGAHSLLWRAAKAVGLGGRLGIVRGARRRRNVWSDRGEARAAYSKKKVFSGWDPETLDDYLDSGLIDLPGGGVYLRYPKEWEARIFSAAPHDLWARLRKLTVPCLFVQGENSDTFLDAARIRVEREIPAARTIVVGDTSHFLPMEKPEELAGLIEAYIQETGDALKMTAHRGNKEIQNAV